MRADDTPPTGHRGFAMALYAGESVRGVARVESARDVVAALSAGMKRGRRSEL